MDLNEIPIDIFLDLSKAFDTTDHTILLHKLNYYGLEQSTLRLIESYLKKIGNNTRKSKKANLKFYLNNDEDNRMAKHKQTITKLKQIKIHDFSHAQEKDTKFFVKIG